MIYVNLLFKIRYLSAPNGGGAVRADTAAVQWRTTLADSRVAYGSRQNDAESGLLGEVRVMVSEQVKEQTGERKQQDIRLDRKENPLGGHKAGRKAGCPEGLKRDLGVERALLRRLAKRRFGEEIAERLSDQLESVDEAECMAEIAEWITDCQTGDELLSRCRDARFG